MASKQEKNLLGLAETATDEEVVARINDLVAASQLLEGESQTRGVKIALAARTPTGRNRGSYVIPPDPGVLVLDIDTMLAEENGKSNLAAIEADGQIIKVRSDTPLTPLSEIRRYAQQ